MVIFKQREMLCDNLMFAWFYIVIFHLLWSWNASTWRVLVVAVMYEVYLPLLEILDNTDRSHQITLGITPILLIQLSNKDQEKSNDYLLENKQLQQHSRYAHFSKSTTIGQNF